MNWKNCKDYYDLFKHSSYLPCSPNWQKLLHDSALHVIIHLIFIFSFSTQGKHTSGILDWQSPLFRQAASLRSGSALRSIMHLIFSFLFLHTQGKHTFGILAWLPPLFRLAASCHSGFALRVIIHLNFRFLSLYAQGKHTSFVGILASLPPRFLYTIAYGMCSVPPHIPYPFRFAPGVLLRKRCSAPLARCLHVPLLCQFTFSQNFLFRAVAQALSNRLLL